MRGRWVWVIFWALSGVFSLGAAILVADWPSILFLAFAAWLFYSALSAYRTDVLVIRDALGREVHRSRKSGV